MSTFTKTVLVRGIRGFITGAVASVIVVAPVEVTDLDGLQSWAVKLSFAAIIGGITGLLQALEKALRWEETQTK